MLISSTERQAITPKLLWNALKDYDMWPIYLLGLTWTIPATPATNYLTLTLRSLNFDTFTTNLLTIPAYVLFLIQLIFWTWVSEKFNNRYLIIFTCQAWLLPLLIAMEVLPGGNAYAWARYALNVMTVGYPYVHAIIGKSTPFDLFTKSNLTSSSSCPYIPQRRLSPHAHRRFRAIQHVRASFQRHRCQRTSLSSLPSAPFAIFKKTSLTHLKIYRKSDSPLYRTGNKVLLGIIAYNMLLIIFTKCYYMFRNSRREKIWNAMTEEEKMVYLSTTKEEGNKRYVFLALIVNIVGLPG